MLWRGFSFLFKVAIVATLVGYFALFVAMMVAFLFARSSSDRDDDGPSFGIGPLLWFWGWDTGPDAYGRRPARAARTKRRAPFYKRVFAFVFGPPAAKVDPLEDEKRIVAHIRAGRGRIAPVDLVRLMGWTFPRAEEEATRLMVDYGGEPEVTDDGVVVYVFKALRKTAGTRQTWSRPHATRMRRTGRPSASSRRRRSPATSRRPTPSSASSTASTCWRRSGSSPRSRRGCTSRWRTGSS